VLDNPFRVLELSPASSARDVEREGARILALIAAGLDDPDRPRTAEDVRHALSELREPSRRALHELFCVSALSEPQPEQALAVLAQVPLAAPASSPLHTVLSQLAGELVPLPSPQAVSPEVAARLEAALEPPQLRTAPVCVDALGLEL
jgi:hypothetical protein